MKGKMKTVFRCFMSVAALSVLAPVAVLAEGSSDSIENTVWTYRAVANVTTQVNIRANASTESAIIGYLPKAGAADIIERGETWSHVISNGVEGYIMNEYLAFGTEARKLAQVYGMPAVEASWDDVKVFAAPNAAAKIIATANEGQGYQVIEETGDWVSVQLDDANTAYIPAEDVKKTILLEKAIPVVTTAQTVDSGSADSQEVPSSDVSTQAENNTDAGVTVDVPKINTETEVVENDTSSESSQETWVPESTPAENVSTDVSVPEASEQTVASASSDDVSLLAGLIYCEAGNQSREGKVAVGAVVMHRVASSSFANSISGVIYQSGQFTPASSGALSRVLEKGVPSGCYEAAQAALNGEDPVPGALYFNTGSGKGVKIGAHQFY